MDYTLPSDRRTYIYLGALIFVSYVLLHIVFGRHKLPAYDFYSHILFAKHYAQHWFYTQVPVEAHGLEIVSYPPLAFQILALIALLPVISYIHASIILVSAGAVFLSFAVYFLFRTLTGIEHPKAPLIVLFIAFSPGLLKFVLVHGQLTMVLGSALAFLSTALFYRILHGKHEGVYLVFALSLTAYTHITSFLIMLIMLAVITLVYPQRTLSRIRYLVPIFLVSGVISFMGLHPLIREILFGVSQGKIPHGSRLPFQGGILRVNRYLTTTYGLSTVGVFLLFKKKLSSFDVNLLTLVFIILGLGLTTPLPSILFDGFASFLVYDKFSLISSLFLTALIGAFSLNVRRAMRSVKVPSTEIILIVFVLAGLGTTFFANNLFYNSATGYLEGYDSGKNTERQAAIEYLNKNASEEYLYVTHGYGSSFREMRRQTDVPTLDTAYYPGRDMGFAESSHSIDQWGKQNFLTLTEKADNFSLKYVFTFDRSSSSWMKDTGWEKKKLESNVNLWLNPSPIPEYRPDLGEKRLLFGLMPILTLVTGIIVVILVRSTISPDLIDERIPDKSLYYMILPVQSTDKTPADTYQSFINTKTDYSLLL